MDSLGDTGASEYIERLSVYLAQTGGATKPLRRDFELVAEGRHARAPQPRAARACRTWAEITPDMTAEELF
ncbi:MAG: hypothetical protein ACLVJ8_15070 [Ruthenibacterium lactatiformans]